MKIIIGLYSQFSFGAKESDFESLLGNCLKPVLTFLYVNTNSKVLMRLSSAELEWLNNNHPEIIMLIKDLCIKNRLELLSSSYNDSILGMVSPKERSSGIEKTSDYIKKLTSKLPHGLWVNYQVFSPSVISAMESSCLDYTVISRYNQVTGNSASLKPFIMDEQGKTTVVFPFDDSLTAQISEDLKNEVNEDKYIENVRNLINKTSNQITTYMLNLDLICRYQNSGTYIVDVLKEINGGILPGQYLENHSLNNYSYLSSSVYGKDYSIGKANSINQLILESHTLKKYYFSLNYLKDIVKNLKKGTEYKSLLEELVFEAGCSSQYIPIPYDDSDYLEYNSKKICELEKYLSLIGYLPQSFMNLDFVFNRNFILHFSNKGAIVTKFNILNNLHDFTLYSESGLFNDIIKDTYSRKSVNLSNRIFEKTVLDRKKNEIVYSLNDIELANFKLNIVKSYKLKQNNLSLTYDITNLSDIPVKNFIFETFFNLSLDGSFNEKFDNKPMSSFSYTGKNRNFGFNCILSEDSEISYKTVIGNIVGYQYTQFKLHKKIDIESNSSVSFSVTLKVD